MSIFKIFSYKKEVTFRYALIVYFTGLVTGGGVGMSIGEFYLCHKPKKIPAVKFIEGEGRVYITPPRPNLLKKGTAI